MYKQTIFHGLVTPAAAGVFIHDRIRWSLLEDSSMKSTFLTEINRKWSVCRMKVQAVQKEEYLSFIEKHPLANFMQYPSWAEVKMDWQHDLLGWFEDNGKMVGCALVLYRKMPAFNKFLAYIPRGPLIDWNAKNIKEWFLPLFDHLKERNVFTVKMDPPVVRAKWHARTIQSYIRDIRTHGLKGKSLTDVGPDWQDPAADYVQQVLTEMGWKKKSPEEGFSTVQPQFEYRLNLKDRTLDEVWKGFRRSWRQNIRKAEKKQVVVTVGEEQDLDAYYDLLKATAERKQFGVRNYAYFQQMFRALKRDDEDRIRLYLAIWNDQLLSAALMLHTAGHVWVLYGASHYENRDKMPNYALHWRMIQDAHGMGAHTYDFRGISPSLDAESPLFGLLNFQLGFRGEACQLIGEWDYPLQPMLYWAFDMYMKKR
jgi:lipid II:glycine glycyltransferase (peptidoglycan interpeptide bridge formation enzyme)